MSTKNLGYTSEAEGGTDTARVWERTDWLLIILGLSGDALPAIREEVTNMLEDHGFENGEWPSLVVSREMCSKLIKQTAMKVGAMGGITAIPSAFLVIGSLGTAMVGTTADFAYLIRKQIELCYAISAVYDMGIDEEKLQAIVLALLGFSGTGQIAKEIAATSLRSIVDVTVSRFLKKGPAEAVEEVAPKLVPRLLGRSYKLIPFLGIPLSASMNVASTMMLGNEARKYFSSNWQGECY